MLRHAHLRCAGVAFGYDAPREEHHARLGRCLRFPGPVRTVNCAHCLPFSGPADGRWLAPGVSLRPAHHVLPRAYGCVSNWCVGQRVTAQTPDHHQAPSRLCQDRVKAPPQSLLCCLHFPCGNELRGPARCGWYLAGTWLVSQEDQRRIFPDSEQPRRERIAGVTS